MKAPRFLRTKRNRLIFFGSILVICVSTAIYFALQEQTYAEQFLNQFFQPKVSKFLLIAIPSFVTVIVLGVSNEIFSSDFHDWLKGKNEEENDNGKLTDNIEPDLKILYDSLKERYKKRYESKLDGRFEITLEVNEDWRFDKPATYKFSAEAKVSEAATAVRNAFDEKGRLLIVGNAGSGKTVLLLNLARQLLGDELKKDQQIPVIFNLASWRETHENFEDWLVKVLNTGNGLSKDFAKTVLREKKIIFLLDGLDELARNEENAHEIRAECLESLNDYLREGRRTVICCRREEFAAMQKTTKKDAPVSAKVEVLDLTKADIILALQQAQTHNESRAAAENLEKLIETNETVLEVLSTPFYFTTALEVFDKPNFNDHNLSTDADKLKTYLLKNYVDNKIKYTAKLTEFEKDPNKIKHWLTWLARFLEWFQIVNFELSFLHQDLLKNTSLFLLIFSLLGGLSVSLLFHIFVDSSATFLIVFCSFSLMCYGRNILFRNVDQEEKYRWDLASLKTKRSWIFSILFGVILGVLVSIGLLLENNLLISLTVGGIFSLCGLCFGLFLSMKKPIRLINLRTDYQRLSARTLGNILESFIWYSILALIIYSLQINEQLDITANILFKFLMALGVFWGIYTLPIVEHFLVRIFLWFEGSMPLKYATFLDLAAEARILEKDGGQWRFRHQNLQEYFANLEIETDK